MIINLIDTLIHEVTTNRAMSGGPPEVSRPTVCPKIKRGIVIRAINVGGEVNAHRIYRNDYEDPDDE